VATDSNTQKLGNVSIQAVGRCNSTLRGYTVLLAPFPTGPLPGDDVPRATQDSSAGTQPPAVMKQGGWERKVSQTNS